MDPIKKFRIDYALPGSPLAESVNRGITGAFVVYIDGVAELVTQSAKVADNMFRDVADHCIVDPYCMTRSPDWGAVVEAAQRLLPQDDYPTDRSDTNPNDILKAIEEAMQSRDVPKAMNLCAGLRAWLMANGPISNSNSPSWQDYPSAYSYYTLWLNYASLTEAVQALKSQI